MTRRQAIKTAALAAIAYPSAARAAQIAVQPKTNITGAPKAVTSTPVPTGPFKLPPLPYSFEALEPHIDTKTMQVHHNMHHATYVANLNRALAEQPQLGQKSVEDLLRNLYAVPEAIRTAVRNNGGGHANHSLFWEQLSPKAFVHSRGEVHQAIAAKWGMYDRFKEEFTKAALGIFGSGWAWLTIGPSKDLAIETTPNQDSPLMAGRLPLMGLDVWEHAYYLKYQNRRADYINAFFKVLDWNYLLERFKKLAA